jgi:pyridoxine 5-phosphate synthase
MEARPIRPRLGVNVDHVATIRQARGTRYPDPIAAASIAERAGADQITVHLREDRRHIQDRDVRILRETVETRLNLEMGATEEMSRIAREVRPDMITLVPERREEQTTEGGLDVAGRAETLGPYVERLRDSGAEMSLFIDPDPAQIEASAQLGVEVIELHTGDYCRERRGFDTADEYATHVALELGKLRIAASLAAESGLKVAAGHGLDYKNVLPVAGIAEFEEFNIGHSIVARAVLVGLDEAVREMITALETGRAQFQET